MTGMFAIFLVVLNKSPSKYGYALSYFSISSMTKRRMAKKLVTRSFFGFPSSNSAILGFFGVLWCIINKLMRPEVPMGYSSMMTAIIFIGGMLMLMLGMIGEYIGRTYICINRAPQYVIRKTIPEKHDE